MSTQSKKYLDIVERTLAFVHGLHDEAIFEMLVPYGMRTSVVDEAWQAAFRLGRMDAPPVGITHFDAPRAIRELDAWDEQGFALAQIALRRSHPEQAAFLLSNLTATEGAQSVVGVKVFLDRLDELESSEARAATRDKDQSALAVLAERGIDVAERNRLRELIGLATGAPDGSKFPPDATKEADAAALEQWLEDWSETARLVIKRRDHLIRLGLVKRTRRKSPSAASATVTNVPAAGVPVPFGIPTNGASSNGALAPVPPGVPGVPAIA